MLVKSLLKNMLVPALASPPLSNLGAWLFGQGVPIFMLHRMQFEGQTSIGISPEHLRRCLQYLTDKGYHFISLEEIFESLNTQLPLPPKAVAFTVDDGYWDQAEIAAPIFAEFNCPATFFVITGMLDKSLWPWDSKVSYLIDTTKKNAIQFNLADEDFLLLLTTEQEKRQARNILHDTIKSMAGDSIDHSLELLANATGCDLPVSPPDYLKPMEWERARQLEKIGIKFAPHTLSHQILSKLDAASAQQEIMGSWQRVQDELASPSPVFAYPTGRFMDYGPREVNLLKESGFLGAVSTLPETIEEKSSDPNYKYNLPRLGLPNEFNDFVKYCSWIEQAATKLHNLR